MIFILKNIRRWKNDYAAQKFIFEKGVNECKDSAIVIERPERDYFLSNL